MWRLVSQCRGCEGVSLWELLQHDFENLKGALKAALLPTSGTQSNEDPLRAAVGCPASAYCAQGLPSQLPDFLTPGDAGHLCGTPVAGHPLLQMCCIRPLSQHSQQHLEGADGN